MSMPAIEFLAVQRCHVGFEVTAGREDKTLSQVAITGEDGILNKRRNQVRGATKMNVMGG
jgi:hypothetical protein